VSAELDVEQHLNLALGCLEEGKKLVDEDPIQASEKLYKASEEAVKALACRFTLGDVLERVGKRGRWGEMRDGAYDESLYAYRGVGGEYSGH